MAAVREKQARRWTYEEYYQLDDDQRYEIIDGNLLMAPAPDTWHQDWSRELSMLVVTHVKRHKLGKVFIAPVDVVLDEETPCNPTSFSSRRPMPASSNAAPFSEL